MNPDPIKELQNAVDELNDREHELKAAVGISNILLEKNKNLLIKCNQAFD